MSIFGRQNNAPCTVCTVHSVLCALHRVQCILHSVHYAQYLHLKMHRKLHSTLHETHWTLCTTSQTFILHASLLSLHTETYKTCLSDCQDLHSHRKNHVNHMILPTRPKKNLRPFYAVWNQPLLFGKLFGNLDEQRHVLVSAHPPQKLNK